MRGLIDGEAIVSAGGSAYFDRVRRAFGGRDDVVCVLRSGCYVTQDGGFYEERLAARRPRAAASAGCATRSRSGARSSRARSPTSRSSSFGKRDVPFDLGAAAAAARARAATAPVAGVRRRGGRAVDQHAHVRLDPAAELAVGDLLGAEISHPCGAFERWKLLFVVNDERRVTGGVLTFL